jgi:hypothetical protein
MRKIVTKSHIFSSKVIPVYSLLRQYLTDHNREVIIKLDENNVGVRW